MEINPNALPDRDFLAFLRPEEISALTDLARLREEAEAEIERLIALVDALDGDCDLEPSLGYFQFGQPVDAEEEHDGREPDHDDEDDDPAEDDGTAEEEPDREPEEPEHPGYVLNRADIALRQRLRGARARRRYSPGETVRIQHGAAAYVVATVE